VQKCCIWTRGKAIIQLEIGSEFKLFDGNISGFQGFNFALTTRGARARIKDCSEMETE
jgi:hypothetical protein